MKKHKKYFEAIHIHQSPDSEPSSGKLSNSDFVSQ